MAALRVLGFLICSALASSADLHIPILPGQVVEQGVTFSKDDLATEPLLWVRENPDRVVVSVISPDGHVYSGASRDESAAILIQFADRKSSSQNELALGQMLDSDGTLVGWKKNASPGVYTLRLEGKLLPSRTEVTVRRMTSEGLVQEILAIVQKSVKESIASLYAAPQQQAKFDAQGQAKLILTGTWQKDDIILMGATADAAWTAAIGLPDGAMVTEANAKTSGCNWRWSDSDETMLNPLPEVHGKLLAVACPERMQNGPITIIAQAPHQNPHGQLVALVLRPSNIDAQLEKNLSAAGQTVALRSKPEGPSADGDYRSAVVDRPIAIRLDLDGGGSPIAEVAVSGQAYRVDSKHSPPVNVFGPDPAKKLYGTTDKIARDPNGDFVYSFKTQEPGIHQLDFKAEGVFQNGRRFEADTIVTVFVHRVAARLTGIQQQRIERNNLGHAHLARFVLALEVAEPGRYSAHIQVGDAPNQVAYAYGEAILDIGKQTMLVDGNAKFVAKLAENPDAQLTVRIETRRQLLEGDFPSEVVMDTAIPKASEFEAPAPGRSEANAAGATWRISGSDIALTVPVSATGTACRWAAMLELTPRETRPNEVIRTLGYWQSGAFVPLYGKAVIHSLWSLNPFFADGRIPAQQAFVFRLKDLRCGANRGYVTSYEANAEPSPDVYTMPFSADLKGLKLTPMTDNTAAATPHVAGTVAMEPLDQDGDGKFDHLRARFNLASPGGTCLWWDTVSVGGRGSSTVGRAETTAGINPVSMDLDVVSTLSLHDFSVFSFRINMIKCGAGTSFTQDEIRSMLMNGTVIYQQEFAIDSQRFAALGEFEPR
ncbi:MAG TPA: hypothetical protein VGP62_30370 [Bryobacteraceae bacterium]|nr:hypothetical protein [Bryobacteraceae bacterium]